MKRLKTAVIGMGYISVSHIDALRRIPECELYAVADTNAELARQKAEAYAAPRYFASWQEAIRCPDIDVVHNCTPTNLHTVINKAAISAGKHLFTEKPLALSAAETDELIAHSRLHPGVAVGVNYNYRMNPMVQDMRKRLEAGAVGDVLAVSGCYLQDWLLYDTDYSWRLEPAFAGPSCAVADIGTHWMDLVQHVTGLRITELMADLRATYPVRKKPKKQTETFAQSDGEYVLTKVENEDYGSVLFHLENGARGVFTVSEVSAGHGCYFQVEINGSKQSLMWNQEQNDRLWIGRRNGENSLVLRDPSCLSPAIRTSLAKGHPEGWNDAFSENISAFYRHLLALADGRADTPVFATLEEAARLVRLTEACVESSKQRRWVKLED